MDALDERKKIDLYVSDLIWVIAQKNLVSEIPTPSDLWFKRINKDKRSAKQIKADLLAALGGG